MSVAFDTLSAAEEFQKTGMTKDQAKVQVGTISKALGILQLKVMSKNVKLI